jgi:hypothetical protein
MLACHLLRAPAGAKVAGYIGGIIVLVQEGSPWADAMHRLIETALGISVAWLVGCVPKLIRTQSL